MLRLNGRANAISGDVVMTTTINVSVGLSSRGLVTTKSMKPSLSIGDVMYTREYNRRYERLRTQSIVLQQANDFSGYRISFFNKQFKSKLEAYQMCLDLLVKELGLIPDDVMMAMPTDLLDRHGFEFARDISESVLDSIFEPFNDNVSEFKIVTDLGIPKQVRIRIKQVVNIDDEQP